MSQEYYKQDDIYIKKDKKIVVKELYKEIKKTIEKNYEETKNLDILDIGAASGELLYYLKDCFNIENTLFGIEKSPDLVKNAKLRFGDENIEFIEEDAQTFKVNKKFDVIIMKGVITIFDDFKPSIDRILEHLKKDGMAVIVSIFNDYEIDVRIKFKKKEDVEWNTGYNLFPISDVQNYIKIKGFKTEVYEHVMPFDLEKQENHLRAWTVNLNGKRHLINGLNLIYNMKILVIKK